LHSFVVVVRKPERQIPPHVFALLKQRDTADLCFAPDEHLFWCDEHESVAFGGWQVAADIANFGSHWHVDKQGVTAFSGRLWPVGRMWNGTESWAQQLAAYWATNPIVDSRQALGGIYAGVSIGKAGIGTIVTDPLTIGVLYRAETNDFIAYSTAVRLAARATTPQGREPERDPLGVAWLPLLGWLIGDRTGFVGTRVLPAGSHVDISPAYGSRLRYSNPTPWAPAAELPSDDNELIELVRADLGASVRSIAQIPSSKRYADITGGRDSRLILALIIQEGLTDRFEFRTTGFEHAPDSVAGRAIAERFKLSHESVVPIPMRQEHFRRQLATHVFHTAGMFSAWDFKGALIASTAPRVCGLVGETLRTNFKGYPPLSSIRELRDEFYRRANLGTVSIVSSDVRSKLLENLDAELLERVDAGGSPQDLLDSFYIRHRLRRWFGTAEELGEAGRVFPLYSLVGIQAAFALGPVKRRNELLPFAVMRRACPELAKMPFADAGWSDELLSQVSDGDDYRAPPWKYSGPAPVQWQPARLLDNLDVVKEHLLDDRCSPLYDIIDRAQVMRLFNDASHMTLPIYRQLFGALTAAVWLAHRESHYRIGERSNSEVKRPHTDTASSRIRRPRLLARLVRRGRTSP
jgi:hypothetical protein